MLVNTKTLPKTERLCSKKTIEELFTKGSSVYLYPFRLQYMIRTDGQMGYPQVLFSVSKRHFKRANKRNLVRRRVREIYRLHKYELLSATPVAVLPACLAVIYVSKDILPSALLTQKFTAAWKKLHALDIPQVSHPSI
jgi:ribonuclease P protein component